MPKVAQELGPLAVSRLKEPGRYPVGGVAGLELQIKPSGARTWVLRTVIAGKRREVGLGGFPSVTLAGARDAARDKRRLIAAGTDPVSQRRADRSALAAARAKEVTFRDAAEAYIKANERSWRSAKHGAQWRATLETYAYPVMGSLLVRDVTLTHVLAVLEPIWTTKTETATRVRGRVEKILDWAKVRGMRSGDNPAAWKGNLETQIPPARKVARVVHRAALPYSGMGEFWPRLRAAPGMGARALEFAILTAARSGEVRGARWSEIDMQARVWSVPAERMKGARAHRVPLSDAALTLLKALPKTASGADDVDPLIFPAVRGGTLSDMTLSAVLRRMEIAAVPHGFRSTFRDWAAETTSYPHEAQEMALAHAIESDTEASYRRGDMLEVRRPMMQAWADYLLRQPAAVVSIKPRRGRVGRVAA